MKSVTVYQSPMRPNAWIVETSDNGVSSEQVVFLGIEAEDSAHAFAMRRRYGRIGCQADQLIVQRTPEARVTF